MRSRLFSSSFLVLSGLALVAGPASAVTIDWVAVGNPGNPADSGANCYAANCGSVSYSYSISKYDVTNAQYAEFLNAKAEFDPLELYNPGMASDADNGGITQSGSPGSYSYAVKPGFANKPVVYVSFYDALRFANWLNNGQGTGGTETGAYTLLGGTPAPSNGTSVLRNFLATTFLPSENEWYKAAYYSPGGAYFAYPTRNNTLTVCAAPTGAANSANCGNAVGKLSDVGAYSGSASPYGTFDQGGNVWQWNEQMVSGSARVIRGGSWGSNATYLASLNPYSTTGEYHNVGFRVATLVPEPGTTALGMTALAALTLLRRRPAKAL